MKCLTELTWSVFADGELPDVELRQVEEHLKSCPSCRTMAEAFREEKQFLVHCIQEIDFLNPAKAAHAAKTPVRSASPVAPAARPAPVARPAPAARPKDLAKWGGMLVGVSALIRMAMSSPENFVLPSLPVSLDWLDPSNLTGRLNWLIGATVFVAAEGVSRLMSIVNGLSVVALYLLILAGFVTVVRRSIGKSAVVATLATLGTIVLMAVSSPSSYAMEVRKGGRDKFITIPAGQTVDDSLFITGGTIIIDGIVTGDVIAFARQVTINGTIKGNLLTGAQSINVPGSIEGSVVAGGQSIQVNGKIARNLVSFGQSSGIGKDANIGGDAATFGNESHMNGTLAHNFYAFGVADIAGNIGRSVVFRGSTISVLPSARIGGDLTAYVPRAETVHIGSGAVISGKQTIELPKPGPNRYTTFKYYFSEVLHVAAAFIFGMILFLLFPALRRIGFTDAASTLISGGVGFLGVVAMPIAACILLVTLIGLPVAIVGFIAWMLGLYLAKIIIGNFVGRTLFSTDSERPSSLALNLFVGLVLVFILINLPFVGGLVHFLLVIIGFGALATSLYRSYQTAGSAG